MTKHRAFLALLVVLWTVAGASAAPIFGNLGDSTHVKGEPDVIEFWSEEPFRHGAFATDNYDGNPVMDNPFNPFIFSFDGVFYRATWYVDRTECRSIQVDGDSHDFPGIGYLINYNGRGCRGPEPPDTPEAPEDPEDTGDPVPEPPVAALVITGVVTIWAWRQRA